MDFYTTLQRQLIALLPYRGVGTGRPRCELNSGISTDERRGSQEPGWNGLASTSLQGGRTLAG